MLAVLLASLLAIQPLPSAVVSEPLSQSVEEAIERCERLEYSQPLAAMEIADHGLTLDADMAATERGLLLACRAWSQMQLGEMEQARELTLEIDILAGRIGEPRARVGLLMRLASLFYRGGNPLSALEAMDLALELTETHHLDEDLPQVLGNIAIYLTESGQFSPAIEHFQRILALAENDQGGHIPMVPVRYNLARALLLDGRAEEAMDHLHWLVPAMQTPGMEPRLATALGMTGTAWRQLGDLDQAADFLGQADLLHQQFENPGERSSLRRDQAQLAQDLGNFELAEAYAREALSLARQIEYERSILSALELLVDLLATRGAHAEALELHREYAGRNQSFLETSQRSRLDVLETRLGMQRQALEIEELRQTSEVQQLRLSEESLRRQVAWASLLAVLVIALALSIWQRVNQQRLLRISRTDPLTGLANRRYLTLQMQGSASEQSNAILFLLDLDHFKQINDRYGHDTGDQVLRKVSSALQRVANEHGALCGRWGGEEFALFLADGDIDSALRLAEDLHREISALKILDDHGNKVSVAASLGFAPIRGLQRDSGQEVWEPALKCADLLLYQAKHAGRNQGFGIWPATTQAQVNPLAIDSALKSGAFRLLTVPQ